MEKIQLQNDFIEVLYDEELRLYTSIYKPMTVDMTDNEFKEQMLNLNEIYERVRPKYIIDDNSQRKYAYSPEMQNWVLDLFITTWNNIGIKKYAQVLPIEIIGLLTSMQIEEAAVNDFSMNFEYKMCQDLSSAIQWTKKE